MGPSKTFSFADTARSGGFVHVTAFHDINANGYRDAGEESDAGIKMSASPSGDVKYTDSYGKATLYVPVGAYTVTMTPPDSLFASTPNPVSGSMANGDTAGVAFGLRRWLRRCPPPLCGPTLGRSSSSTSSERCTDPACTACPHGQ